MVTFKTKYLCISLSGGAHSVLIIMNRRGRSALLDGCGGGGGGGVKGCQGWMIMSVQNNEQKINAVHYRRSHLPLRFLRNISCQMILRHDLPPENLMMKRQCCRNNLIIPLHLTELVTIGS